MKLLFFSFDAAEVEQTCRELDQAGIPCQVRNCPAGQGEPVPCPCLELWLQDDRDAYRAMMRCAEQEVGFNKRPGKPPPPVEEEGQAEDYAPERTRLTGSG